MPGALGLGMQCWDCKLCGLVECATALVPHHCPPFRPCPAQVATDLCSPHSGSPVACAAVLDTDRSIPVCRYQVRPCRTAVPAQHAARQGSSAGQGAMSKTCPCVPYPQGPQTMPLLPPIHSTAD